jgi:elongation factor Ts
VAAAKALADYALVCPADEGADNILETAINGRKFSEILTETVSKTGEKVQVGDYARYKIDGPGLIGIYIHFNEKVGSMVQIETDSDNAAGTEILKRAAADMAMHVTATKPLALDKSSVSSEIIEQEKAIAAEQVKNKPANIVDKIVEGKLKKFFAENCLVEQQFVKDDSKTIVQVMAEAGKQAGSTVKIKRFVRFGVG